MLEQGTFVANCLEDTDCQVYFANLIDVLKKELAIYQELNDFLSEERKMLLKSSSLEKLNNNNAMKENLILKARILEEGRMNVLKKIAKNLDIDDGAMKLMSLANYAMTQQRRDIEQLKTDLMNIAQDIRKMNDDNQFLLNASINNVNASLELISSLINRSGVYQCNGKIDEIRKNGQFLRTEG